MAGAVGGRSCELVDRFAVVDGNPELHETQFQFVLVRVN
jgi:hypothetical protein